MKQRISRMVIVLIAIFLWVNCNPAKKDSNAFDPMENPFGLLLLGMRFSITGNLSETGRVASDKNQSSSSYMNEFTPYINNGGGTSFSTISDLDVLASVVDPRIGSILKNQIKRAAPNRNHFTIGGNGGVGGNGTFTLEGDIQGYRISFLPMNQQATMNPFLTCSIQQIYEEYDPQGIASVANGGQVIVNGVTETEQTLTSFGPLETSIFYGTQKITGSFTFTNFGKLTRNDEGFVRILTPEGYSEVMGNNDSSLTPCEQEQKAHDRGRKILLRYSIIRSGTAEIATEIVNLRNDDGSITYKVITDIHSPNGLQIERRNFPGNMDEVLDSRLVRFENVRITSTDTSNKSLLAFLIDRKVTVDGVIDGQTVHEELHARIGLGE
ncbi:hypothetical protein AB3N59_00800 [Leptospira sp. WS92.C1]